MNLLSTICLPKFRLARGVAAWLVALALICTPFYGAIIETAGSLDPPTQLTKLALDVDDGGADACLYCGARCHCQHTMGGPQSGVVEPGLLDSAVVQIIEPVLRAVLTGPPDRPPKA